ncbi:MAG: deoxyribose-phosphate aldolase, partial [Bacteroidales bacterium]|nr:deoxyribose-phosphate aldolase [Bacteroidales bacterium]
DDNGATARRLCSDLNHFPEHFPDIPSVAAVCVYPSLIHEIHEELKLQSVSLAAVGAGFPSSQTFLSVKLAECELLVSKGADEIDIVLSVGRFLEGDYQKVMNEIQLIKNIIGDTHLKVILETGLLKTAQNIRMASLIAMEAGADFIKTSTGKLSPAATPEAVYVMAKAIRDYHVISGRMVGLKAAGGISSAEDALNYYYLVETLLGDDWLTPDLFRIGASRLANSLLQEITGTKLNYF